MARRNSPSTAARPAASGGAPAAAARVFGAAGGGPSPAAPPRHPPTRRVGFAGAALSGLALDDWHRRLSARSWMDSALTVAVVASITVHAVILATRFSFHDLRKTGDRGPPLEVVLVNAKSTQRPAKADVLAQANLEGGGNTEANRRARTPLPIPPRSDPASDIAMTAQKAEALERRAQDLMTQLKSGASAPVVPPAVDAPEKTQPASVADLSQRTLEVMRLETQIARDMDAYQKLPKRRQVGVRAEEYRFARYVEDWRQKVERVGNLNYPEAARQLKLYGNLILTVSIRADGSVEKVVIERSSGHRVLDAAATRIVEMAAPYSPFPSDIRRDTEILDITRTWTFARGDELRSE